MSDIKGLRRDYAARELNHRDLFESPFEQFSLWFADIQSLETPVWFEPNAMTLSTVSQSTRVSSRIVLLKYFDTEGFVFFTNYTSEKARDLVANPRVALNFFWPIQERQVRIEGHVSQTEASLSDEYFYSRPINSQVGAILSPQSEVIGLDDSLEQRLEEYMAENPKPIRPAHWGGYRVRPTRFEFWQGRPSRLHDRFRYRKNGPRWKIERLAP